MRRLGGILVTLVVVVAIGVAGFFAIDAFSPSDATEDDGSASGDAPEVEMGTATVVRTDLVETETLDGLLRFRDLGTLMSTAPGTITAMPEGGSVLRRNQVAYELNGTPVIALIGARPMWRNLEIGVTAGPDVEQLESNLENLGFDAEGELTVDDEFTEATSTALTAWQESIGRAATGIATPGDVVFVPSPRRVGEPFVQTGSVVAPGTPLYATSARDHEVVVMLDADRQDLLAVGDDVTVTLPDGVTTPATVAAVSRVVTTEGEGPDARRVVEVAIDLPDESFAGDTDAAPVDVDVETGRASGVLVVPVEALLALAEGGYALEVDTGGETELVPVDIGIFADGLVEVTGEIAAGDTVLVPR